MSLPNFEKIHFSCCIIWTGKKKNYSLTFRSKFIGVRNSLKSICTLSRVDRLLAGVGGGGAGGASAPPKLLIWWKSGQNPWKFGQNLWKFGKNMWKAFRKITVYALILQIWHPTFCLKVVFLFKWFRQVRGNLGKCGWNLGKNGAWSALIWEKRSTWNEMQSLLLFFWRSFWSFFGQVWGN